MHQSTDYVGYIKLQK